MCQWVSELRSILHELLEACLERLRSLYVDILHAVHQKMIATRVKADKAGSELVGSPNFLLYTTSIRSAVSAVMKPTTARRSKTVFFAMTVLTVTAAAGGCPDTPEITLPPVDVEADLGETVSFMCQAQASTSLFWTVNGEHFTHSNDFIELLETTVLNESSCLKEARLNIHALPPVDNTTIICVAISLNLEVGSAFSSPVKITVTGTAAVSKDRLKVVMEPDEPDVLSRSVESVVALGYQNLIELEWNEPFTSDDPTSLKYNVSIANDDQHQQRFEATLNTTSTILSPQIMATCCNYTIAVTAFTQSYIANTTTLGVECLGYPNELQTFEVVLEVIEDNFSATFEIEVPDPDCMNIRISNVTVLIDNLASSNATEKFGPIKTEGHEGEVVQYSINDLVRNSHFETAVIASNKFGSSVSAIAVKFSSHDVQNVSWTIFGDTLTITCVMAKGSRARGCTVILTIGQVVKANNFSADWYRIHSEVSGTFSLDKSGLYLITVYDIEENGDISNSSAWSQTIDVLLTHSTSSILAGSTSESSPKATIDLDNELDQSGSSDVLIIGLISGGVVTLLVVAAAFFCITSYKLHFRSRIFLLYMKMNPFVNECFVDFLFFYIITGKRGTFRVNVAMFPASSDENDYTINALPDDNMSEHYKELPCLWTGVNTTTNPATQNIPCSSESSLTASTSNENAVLVRRKSSDE